MNSLKTMFSLINNKKMQAKAKHDSFPYYLSKY